ncbi:MAG: hypothetical protein A3B74_04940 [Candidatus Kerfeldbacteria bacterium RIFCSPHIGHO2_02_FULL_42_14]|uniref:Bacterial sugar transferase domain-containing protein n=1 Tax=Candidatus Kerfeldbacteria bacterium RIFCSPHIGHO2_02_FULL_42_14 TaxID=1798540 RepID=A0A1G2ARN8_9BACT|nr:MAG: hypothetical protein A3B74_04940 [Candidatus Kerfeldbacteria bacterium RIFCSPHIGHO2_02_FULL_42_14]OGY84884.1 MAG: hypothetical protein A3I91_05305 [Candidatus Kerfeldbacteria bacterium RIFCSPLOWO2_02_FULL_42_19]OGY86797.1 MAG: hypothetical protein A3G01_02605 [Candidatus Kerfeldbacteria bacterium RIFCSPLOWO2_12_FULL_43_9]
MKKSEIAFHVVRIPVDYLMLLAAAFAAYFLRFGSIVANIRPVVYAMPLSEYTAIVFLITAVLIFIFALTGLYSFQGRRSILQEARSIFIGCSTGVLLIIVLIFFQRELFSSRFIIITGWILSIVFVTLGRMIILKVQRALFAKGIGVHKIIIFGSNSSAKALRAMLEQNASFGYKVIQIFDRYHHDTLQQISELHNTEHLNEVIQADTTLSHEEENELVEWCHEKHIIFKYVPNIYETKAIHVAVDSLAGIPIIELIRTPLDGWGRVAKRTLDLFGALMLIILTSPLMVLAAIAIKIEDRGPVIYKNGRVGYRGKIFVVYKFRSMQSEYCTDHKKEISGIEGFAEKFEQALISKQNSREGAVYKIKNDPRVTAVGRWLRLTSIDELPQFFNVLKGDMSLVGPRPHQPKEVAKYHKSQLKLLAIKPGITGLAQISGRSNLPFDEEARLDIYYLENWSLFWDIHILLKTPIALFKKRKAL